MVEPSDTERNEVQGEKPIEPPPSQASAETLIHETPSETPSSSAKSTELSPAFYHDVAYRFSHFGFEHAKQVTAAAGVTLVVTMALHPSVTPVGQRLLGVATVCLISALAWGFASMTLVARQYVDLVQTIENGKQRSTWTSNLSNWAQQIPSVVLIVGIAFLMAAALWCRVPAA